MLQPLGGSLTKLTEICVVLPFFVLSGHRTTKSVGDVLAKVRIARAWKRSIKSTWNN